MYSIGIDIGGTKIAIAIVNQDGGVLVQSVIPTNLSIKPEEMIVNVTTEIAKLVEKSQVGLDQIVGIGIGAPGPLDSKSGLITCPPNLPTWIDIPIVELIKQSFSLPVALENDASMAALAEKWVGAGKTNDSFVYMTISTGIGAGIIQDGRLLRGVKGNAGDIGHTVVDPSFGLCTCGQYGCLESIASGTAIAKRGSEIVGRTLSTQGVFDLYFEGHKEIVALIDRIFLVLGVASVSIINTFDTEKIVIGGGVAKVGEPLFLAIKKYVKEYALNPTGRRTEIIPAQLEQNAGVIGAAKLGFEINKKLKSE
ncbi:ROK family protein [Virgibacillus sp. DJP39]|uniref:ROK family protein n=1 Tax=Virgibacillus sp. DJP39 TaxID=3409790 RepID=UPI003BB6232A